MDAAAFLRGHAVRPGERFGPEKGPGEGRPRG
jgi:hypothetical protein